MSYQIIHILKHASNISVDRGCLVCNTPNQEQRRSPLSDILAVIVAAQGISFSAESLSSLIRNNAIILHCDHKYKPIGKTVGLHRVVHNELLDNQVYQDIPFLKLLWNKILIAKITNQAFVLDHLNAPHKLWDYLKENNIDEGNAARHYWKYYFKAFGRDNPKNRITRGANDKVNGILNYGYAVISAICNRYLIVHGFNPAIGIYHKYRFRCDPLVYDVVEPLRAFCDFVLLNFRRQNIKISLEQWAKYVAGEIVNAKINVSEVCSIKLLSSMEKYITSFSHCFRNKTTDGLYIPFLKDMEFYEKRQNKQI